MHAALWMLLEQPVTMVVWPTLAPCEKNGPTNTYSNQVNHKFTNTYSNQVKSSFKIPSLPQTNFSEKFQDIVIKIGMSVFVLMTW